MDLLQKINGGWNGYTNLFAYRLDIGGGSKVVRFQHFLKEHSTIETLVAFSYPGAQTFHVLNAINSNLEKNRQMKLLFLEQETQANPFTVARRNLYLKQENIKVINGPFWQQMFHFFFYKYFGGKKYTTLGIGGHIELNGGNPYAEVYNDCCKKLNDGQEVIHVFSIASGNMADCFLKVIEQKNNKHQLAGVTTGGNKTFPYLSYKYRNEKNITLHRPLDYSYETYKEKARAFHQKSGFWLDPTHTIHLLDTLDQNLLPKDATIVMWITCPLVEQLYE
jgi:hypothetical protein